MRITVFLGFGPASAGLERNVRRLVERLREMGLSVEYSVVRVPAVDFEDDEFEPFVEIDGREVYLPSVSVDVDRLVDYVLAFEAAEVVMGLLPPPPLAAPA